MIVLLEPDIDRDMSLFDAVEPFVFSQPMMPNFLKISCRCLASFVGTIDLITSNRVQAWKVSFRSYALCQISNIT